MMTTTYTTPERVVAMLRLIDKNSIRLQLSETSEPARSEVEAWINEAEDYIDEQTHHAWRSTTVTNEMHDHHMRWDGFGHLEYAVTLQNRSVIAFTSGTDKIELWNGSAWKDLVLSSNGFTEARDKDYWVDYTDGIIYLVSQRPLLGRDTVRVTYRYGETVVPGDIKRAAEMLAGLQYLESDFYRLGLPDGQDFASPKASIMQKWRDDVEKILEHRKEFRGALVI
jgi:hypothetical protein